MQPDQFLQMARFPQPWKERDLQEYIAQRLKQHGYSVALEVPIDSNRGRIDIVAKSQHDVNLIEVKKRLNSIADVRAAIAQAQYYQSCYLAEYGKRPSASVIALGPDSSERMSEIDRGIYQAEKIALNQGQPFDVDVIFANEDDMFLPQRYVPPTILKASSRVLLRAALALLKWLFKALWESIRSGKPSYSTVASRSSFQARLGAVVRERFRPSHPDFSEVIMLLLVIFISVFLLSYLLTQFFFK